MRVAEEVSFEGGLAAKHGQASQVLLEWYPDTFVVSILPELLAPEDNFHH